jgi:hypothetical protein
MLYHYNVADWLNDHFIVLRILFLEYFEAEMHRFPGSNAVHFGDAWCF